MNMKRQKRRSFDSAGTLLKAVTSNLDASDGEHNNKRIFHQGNERTLCRMEFELR